MKTKLPPPPEIPREDLHELIELGYASKSRARREAAGKVDTWCSHLTFYLDQMRNQLRANGLGANHTTQEGRDQHEKEAP